MRFSLLLRVMILGAVLLQSSCKPEREELSLPYREDVPVLIATHVSSYYLREINFSLDLAVFKGDNEINAVQEFAGLPDSSFKFNDFFTSNLATNTWVRYVVEKAEYIDTTRQSTFSTLLLIDQSASPENFDSTDYYNQRFQAFNAFYKTLNGQGKVIFSTYNRTDDSHYVLKFINNDFSDNWDAVTSKSLLDLTHKQSGSSGLFDALEQALNFILNQNSENKSITLFVRNKDDGKSLRNLAEIISMARLNNVKINVIWLINDTENVDIATLSQLSTKTGGFTVYMNSIYQSTTVFLGLSKLLKREMNFYRVSVNLTVGAPNYFSPKFSTGSTGLFIYYYVSEFYTWSYIPIYLEKP